MNQSCEIVNKPCEFTIDVIIEIPKNSHIKYEYDSKTNQLKCDRILHTPFNYFFNYGFVPKTLSQDGDTLDVVVLMDDTLIPGCLIQCKILGCLETCDDHGIDPKIIACPISTIDPTCSSTNNISDIPQHTLDKIIYFFSHYKDLEKKVVKIGNILDSNAAITIFKDSLLQYQYANNQDTPCTNRCIMNSDGYIL